MAIKESNAVMIDGNVKSVVEPGLRTELFIDDWLIDSGHNVSLRLQPPRREEVVWTAEKPWESETSGYFKVLQDNKALRLYYRGHSDTMVCLVQSVDGIHFTRPNLGMVKYNDSCENNIVSCNNPEDHNFAPFLDTNPAAFLHQRYKAIGGQAPPHGSGLFAFTSADGLHWEQISEQPILNEGAFDSLNVAFWDDHAGLYRCYSRLWVSPQGTIDAPGGFSMGDGVRAIQSSVSSDFISWSTPLPNQYAEGVPLEHLYTSAAQPVPGAAHHLVAFPKRFVESRKKLDAHSETGVSDAIFMSSRDGVHWDRPFLEAWLRPGLDLHNWTQRSNMVATGIAVTSPDEFSLYVSEHYRWPDNRLRRYSLPRHRFASVYVGARGGEFVTRPLKIDGSYLILNYSTSAAGSIQVELQDESGTSLSGYALNDMDPLFGDELDGAIQWRDHSDLVSLKGRTVRLRFVMQDADLFAMRLAESNEPLRIDQLQTNNV